MNNSIIELKKVTHLLPAIEIDMGGFPVKQPMPTQKVNRVDPEYSISGFLKSDPSLADPAINEKIARDLTAAGLLN